MADRVVSYDFRGNFTNLTAGLAASGRAVSDLGIKMTALDKNGAKMRAGLTAVGSAAGKMGLVAAAGLGAIVAVSANFEQAMSKVAATGQDARDSFDDLRQAAIDAGAATAFSASEAAAGVENLLKAGVSAQDVLGGGLAGALDLAAAGGLEVADAAEIAATALTQFKLSGEDVPHVADLLAAGAGKAQGEVSDLAMALKQSGLVASQMGVSIEETTGTLAAFASAGLLGSDAGTSFRTMLLRLANPTAESAELMKELGINAYDAQGNFVGMASVAEQLKTAFEGKTQAERDSALATIFGSDAIRAASVLYEQGAVGVDGWTEKVNDAGFAAETAGIRLDNLKGDLETLRGSLETALIGSGSGSTGILREMTQGLTNVVNAFNGLPGPAKNAASALLAITAVTGGALWFGSKVVGGIASTRQALDDLGISAGRTQGTLGRFARSATGILAVAGAVTILGNELAKATGAKFDLSDLSRDLEALAEGRNSDMLNQVANDLEKLGSTMGSAAEPVYELTTAFGLFGNTGLDNSRDNIEGIDQALAAMVESGNAEQAATIFARITEAMVGANEGASVSDDAWNSALDSFGSYATALGNASPAAEDAAAASESLAASTGSAGDSAAGTAKQINSLAQAMRNQKSTALSAFDAQTQWGEAVRAAREQSNSAAKGLNALTEAGQGNRQALSSLVAAWNAQPAAVKNSQAAYKSARQTFIEVATSMGVGREKAIALAKSLLEVPRKTVARVMVNDDGAMAAITRIRTGLRGIPDETVNVRINRLGDSGIGPDRINEAEGGYIRGPGTSTSDSIPAMLSDREFVVRAAAVDHYGPDFFHRANQMKLADGGMVGGPYGSPDYHSQQSAGRLSGQNNGAEVAALRADLNKSREQVRQIAADLIHLIKDPGGVTNEIVRLQHVTAQASRGVGQELAEAFNTSVSSGATGRGRR